MIFRHRCGANHHYPGDGGHSVRLSQKYINNAEDMIDGAPVILVEHGQMLRGKMKEADITYDDIMVSARNNQGIDKLDDIKYAILERNGHISIIAKSP
jgi:uncharacterized membrane protein YcaP (DUF421 family)